MRNNTVGEKIVLTSGSHNCGGKCILKVHVKDNIITRIDTDDTLEEGNQFQLRACLRCRGYKDHLYHPNRITTPLKRIGKRGDGKFVPISWDEALESIALHTNRIMNHYGPEGIYLHYATGNTGLLAEKKWMARLLGIMGGYLSYYGDYSHTCTEVGTKYTFGTAQTGNSREDWIHSKLMILFGFNPAETIYGTNTTYHLKRAKEAGARIIVIDPRYTDTAIALADEWIPIKPTTDSALLDAMAYVIITKGLYDNHFLDRFCIGFDETHMPEDIPYGYSYKSYIMGLGKDHTPKTPQWAESITGIPKETIIKLATDYGSVKPGALIQGWGPQRHANGEQTARSGTALAALTGNIGTQGGWASGSGFIGRNPIMGKIPIDNPCKAQIPVFTWTDAITRGIEMGEKEGVKGVPKLSSNIKLIFNLAGNCLVNQHSDINATTRILENENLVEFIVVSDHYITSSAKYADIILPSDHFLEREDIVIDSQREYILFMNKAVDTVGECRNAYDWIADLAEKLGVKNEFTQGKSLEQWLESIIVDTQRNHLEFPSLQELREQCIYRWKYEKPFIAFEKEINDPINHPFPTSSGQIEIFSKDLWNKNNLIEIPAVPQYVPTWEGPQDQLIQKYPLQCIGFHDKRRVHSTLDNNQWMKEIGDQEIWINPVDAQKRNITNGELVLVYNSRGKTSLHAKVTMKIMEGVVAIPQGAWYKPDMKGIDQGGSINVLTKYHPTPLAFANPQHTNLVEVVKGEKSHEY